MSMSDFKVLERLGEGAHGIVVRARHLATGRIVALKKVGVRPNQTLPINIFREIKALQHLDHPNIIALDHVFTHGSSFTLCFEYIPQDLSSLLKSLPMGQRVPALHIKTWMHMLLEGVEYMHALGMVHRDLKPANLLICESGLLKIADFGQARLLPRDEEKDEGDGEVCLSHQVATRWYRAPELLYGARHYTNAVDLWAIGCIFGELLNRSPLFPGQNDIDQLYVVLSTLGTPTDTEWPDRTSLPDYHKIQFPDFAKRPFEELIPDVSPTTLDLVRKFLAYYGPHRVSAKGALKHAYFQTAPFPIVDVTVERLPMVEVFGNVAASKEDAKGGGGAGGGGGEAGRKRGMDGHADRYSEWVE
ncbi:cyclin-dependent kinase 20-like protein [Catenaria anguillulae PL171]|uniref:cyclin-dependent kinase n=1 Tax=Catenaria anguillulae PL171 TaxID=765915 RepID=A0A1Y2I1K9_9FUNG|nr:cyclin-dependent kinase 20-like protein [Catenaria anguillulae PL171]